MSSNCNVFFVIEALESAIINVKRLYKCGIEEINNMFVDDTDFEGLYFWNNDAKSYIKEIQKQWQI